jgi:peroxiredoxin
LDRAHEELRSAGGEVVCVFQYRAQPTRNFCRQREVELECLGDPDRAAYDAVGLERGGVRELATPKIGIAAIRAAREGALVGDAKGGDRRLMPATFVVGRDGRVLFAHYHRDQSDNPPVEPVLDAVRRASTRDA